MMAEQIKDVPAFPTPFGTVQGMTLRDWFAGQALVGQLSGREAAVDASVAATVAYVFADAMIAARQVSNPPR